MPRNRKRYNAWARENYRKNPERKKAADRKSYLKVLYNLTLVEYDKMFKAQHGVCILCGKPPVNKKLGVDHDHKTGEVRGLLCVYCNTMLGHIEKNPKLISNIIKYLAGGKDEQRNG